ncbi:MAG TPA: hypothetical protein VII81_04165, partial [Terriglobales bacterium]
MGNLAAQNSGHIANAGPVPAPLAPKVPPAPRKFTGLPDRIFKGVMLLCALSVLGIVALVVTELVTRSKLSLHEFGWKFFFSSQWDPV